MLAELRVHVFGAFRRGRVAMWKVDSIAGRLRTCKRLSNPHCDIIRSGLRYRGEVSMIRRSLEVVIGGQCCTELCSARRTAALRRLQPNRFWRPCRVGLVGPHKSIKSIDAAYTNALASIVAPATVGSSVKRVRFTLCGSQTRPLTSFLQ